jgi:hypothetical protein
MSLKHALISIIALFAWSSIGVAQYAQAPGQPIFDCTDAQARYDRLSGGLAVQQDAITRTDALLKSLQEESRLGSEEAKNKRIEDAEEQVKDASKEILKEEVPLRAKLAALKAAGATTKGVRKEVLDQIDQQLDLIEDLSKGLQSYQAGVAYGQQIQTGAHTLSQHLTLLNQLLANSGIYEEAGGQALGVFLGPAGPLAFKGLLFLVDASVEDLQASDLEQQIQQAANNSNILHRQYNDVVDKMQEIKANCLEKPITPPDKASTPPPATSQLRAPGASHTGLVLLMGGLGAAGAVAYAAGVAMKNASTSDGGGSVSGHCDGTSPSNACGACSCTQNVNCGSASQCGGGDCWTSGSTPPFC